MSEAFLHALKAPASAGQIQIASTAWDDKSLFMPNKGEVIAEWILTRLLKDKAAPPTLNPILDVRFWTLLSRIVSDQTKSVKHWLLPLLNRLPVAPVVVSFLQLSCALETNFQASLSSAVNSCLNRIWPLAVHKISAETLLECFGAFAEVLEKNALLNHGIEQIGVLIGLSLHAAAGNSSNKKKLSSLLIHNHLQKWIVSMSNHPSLDLQKSLYLVGIEIIFNADTLRQTHDEDHPLFAALRSIPDDVVHPILPRLFASFVQCNRKQRNALFGQSSGHAPAAVAELVRSASFTFFDSCQSLLNMAHPTVLTWDARVGLLTAVGDENLFNGSQLDGQMSLQSVVPLVLKLVGSEYSEHCAAETSQSVACLTKLMQIDHDLILKDVPRILPALLRIPEPFPSIFNFLELLLEYHVKTRTMQTHVETLFAALASQSQATGITEIQHEYRCSSSSAFLHPIHLNRLAKSTETYLIPSQICPTVKFILETLQTRWSQISATSNSESGRLALTFSFSARLASVILTALPMQTLSEGAFKEVSELINRIRNDFLSLTLTKTLKTIRKNTSDSWGSQIIAAAILRLAYALDMPYTEKLWSKVETASKDEHSISELSLELFRILLKWSSGIDEPAGMRNPVDGLLSYLEHNYGSLETSWSGTSYTLVSGPRGKSESVLAILHMLIERWLPTIDAIASTPQLQKFVRILLRPNINAYVCTESCPDATSLLLNALSSAQFWELPNLRRAILAFADEATSALTDPHLNLTTKNHAAVSSTYLLLLLFPLEYLSRTIRTELVRRAINADVLFADAMGHSSVTVLRVFIHNASLYIGSIDQSVATLSRYLTHLMHCSSLSQAESDTSVTFTLIGLHFSALLKSSEETNVLATIGVLRSFLESDILDSLYKSRVVTCLVQVLTKDFTLTQLSKSIQDEVYNLKQHLSIALVRHTEDMGILFANEQFMNVWLHTRLLGRCFKHDGDRLPLVGRKLCFWASTASATSNDLEGNYTTAFAILVEEFHSSPNGDRLSHLDCILAVYVSFSRILSSKKGQTRLDLLLSQTCSTLNVADFCHMLDVTRECLSDTAHSCRDKPHLVHLAALLLSEHPQGTLKHTQKFLTNCLNLFAGGIEFSSGPLSLRLEVLRLLRQQCSDSPASLLTPDIGAIWLLLCKFLTKSKQHDETTCLNIFHEITTVVGALIRLRRDLVALTLPNLGLVLQQLMATIRRSRPQLGARQTALVADTLPRWINLAFPIGPEETRALARLLETLTTKTTIRTNTSSASEFQRTESLARPFSKHAAYIVKAYIDAMNDPLCLLPAELRKELRPGLFALCSMLNEHSRDAMMVSAADAGGKAIMKNLWTEYEKQKYVGKG